MPQSQEAWLSGPIDGVPPLLMPAAHALLQARTDLAAAVADFPVEHLWHTPGGAASVGFHLRHIAGSIDRLLTYARGEALSPEMFAKARTESTPGDPTHGVDELLHEINRAIDDAIAAMRTSQTTDLLSPREVGRARLPTTLMGLLFHIAEHTQRHTGQVITTVKIMRGLR